MADQKKCVWGQTSCTYLGHRVGGERVELDASKESVIEDFVSPKTKKQVRHFRPSWLLQKIHTKFCSIFFPLNGAPGHVIWNCMFDNEYFFFDK